MVEKRMWESLVSFPNTAMAGGARPPRRLAPGRYPGYKLSITEALHVVSMKLSEADDTRYVHRARLVESSRNKLYLAEASPFQRFVFLNRECNACSHPVQMQSFEQEMSKTLAMVRRHLNSRNPMIRRIPSEILTLIASNLEINAALHPCLSPSACRPSLLP